MRKFDLKEFFDGREVELPERWRGKYVTSLNVRNGVIHVVKAATIAEGKLSPQDVIRYINPHGYPCFSDGTMPDEVKVQMVPVITESWINIYEENSKTNNSDANFSIGGGYTTKELADKNAAPGRIDCIRVEVKH